MVDTGVDHRAVSSHDGPDAGRRVFGAADPRFACVVRAFASMFPGRRCTPARLGRHIRQRRQQHPPTAWTPHALPLTDVPASSALGAHLDHQTSLVTSPPRTGTALSAPSTGVEAGFRAGLGAPGRGTSSTTQLPTTIHSFHSFIHSGKNPTNGVNTGSIRQPGPQLWITAPVNAFSSTAWQVPERNGLSH